MIHKGTQIQEIRLAFGHCTGHKMHYLQKRESRVETKSRLRGYSALVEVPGLPCGWGKVMEYRDRE